MTVKIFMMSQKIVSNQFCFLFYVTQQILKKNHDIHKNEAAQLFLTLKIVEMFLEQ